MDSQLSLLQAQLAALKAQSTLPSPTPIVPVTQAVLTEPDVALEALKKMIKEEVAAQFKKVESPSLKTYTFIEAVEEVLSTSDQEFLANLTVINALPAWMVTEGRGKVQEIIKAFRANYES